MNPYELRSYQNRANRAMHAGAGVFAARTAGVRIHGFFPPFGGDLMAPVAAATCAGEDAAGNGGDRKGTVPTEGRKQAMRGNLARRGGAGAVGSAPLCNKTGGAVSVPGQEGDSGVEFAEPSAVPAPAAPDSFGVKANVEALADAARRHEEERRKLREVEGRLAAVSELARKMAVRVARLEGGAL